ncbi:GDSL-type esterase/lipase family protein [Methylobacterium oxalidis]|uniref:GDSL-type esterase/lipase family protein n=1 Tax=Methylobacterium oxalidis TaxID=944322 RepID=UPI0033160E07
MVSAATFRALVQPTPLSAEAKNPDMPSWLGYARAVICMMLGVLASVGPARSAGPDGVWSGTWAAAVQGQAEEAIFRDQTLRQSVRASLAGTAVRVRISNLHGTRPLVIGVAKVALQQANRAGWIRADSVRSVTFAGASSVTIAAGDSILSDAVPFDVPERGDVVVDLYLPEETGPATVHRFAERATHVIEGNAAGQERPEAARKSRDLFFLTNLDVSNDSARGVVVALGASITNGSMSSVGASKRWTDILADRLSAADLRVGVLNLGISGNRMLADGAGPSAGTRFERDVLDQVGVRWVILSDNPINDLGVATYEPSPGGAPTAEALTAAIRELVGLAHRRGIKVICSTLTPYRAASYWSAPSEIIRGRVNAYLRGSESGCDGILDQDAAIRDPADSTRFNRAFDSGDHLHPNDAGHAAIAAAVDLALFSREANGGW